jgi:hypothetical protein
MVAEENNLVVLDWTIIGWFGSSFERVHGAMFIDRCLMRKHIQTKIM